MGVVMKKSSDWVMAVVVKEMSCNDAGGGVEE